MWSEGVAPVLPETGCQTHWSFMKPCGTSSDFNPPPTKEHLILESLLRLLYFWNPPDHMVQDPIPPWISDHKGGGGAKSILLFKPEESSGAGQVLGIAYLDSTDGLTCLLWPYIPSLGNFCRSLRAFEWELILLHKYPLENSYILLLFPPCVGWAPSNSSHCHDSSNTCFCQIFLWSNRTTLYVMI